jgi:ABC-type molybdate transport system substrate-binding protein
MEKQIQELKKGDVFIFNDTKYTVQKKFRSDDSPLKTECGQLFHWEELKVIVPDKPRKQNAANRRSI